MFFEQAKSLAVIGYPQPETKHGTAWVCKHAPHTIYSFTSHDVKLDQRVAYMRLVNECRQFCDAFYAPTNEEMLRVLSEYGSQTDSMFHLRMHHGYDKYYVEQVLVHPNGTLGEILLHHSEVRETYAYLGMILQLANTSGRDLLLKCAREVQHWLIEQMSF